MTSSESEYSLSDEQREAVVDLDLSAEEQPDSQTLPEGSLDHSDDDSVSRSQEPHDHADLHRVNYQPNPSLSTLPRCWSRSICVECEDGGSNIGQI